MLKSSALILSLRALQETYPFIDFGSGIVHVNNDLNEQNASIVDLNNSLDLNPTVNPGPYTS